MRGDPKISMDTVRTAQTLIEESDKASKIGLLNVIGFAVAFEKCERILSAINTRACDRAVAPRDASRQKSTCAKVADMAAQLGISIQFDDDPRGSSVRIMTPKSGRYNSWGGAESGWYV